MELTNVYNLLRETCGLSQQDAADYHGTRLDSVKSWCSNRRQAPQGVINELQALARAIAEAGEAYAGDIQRRCDGDVVIIGLPHDEEDARSCGFPSLGAQMRAIGIAVARLPPHLQILMTPRIRGALAAPAIPSDQAKAPKMSAIAKAEFKGKLEYVAEGVQASYAIFIEDGEATRSCTDIKLLPDEAQALEWLDRHAMAEHISTYTLTRVDENGKPIKKPLQTRL